MHSFCLAIGAFCGTIGFALLFAGYMSLIGQDDHERDASRKRYAAARAEGGEFAGYLEYTRTRNEVMSFARQTREWSHRTGARQMICFGALAMLIAILAWVAASRWFQSTPTPSPYISAFSD